MQKFKIVLFAIPFSFVNSGLFYFLEFNLFNKLPELSWEIANIYLIESWDFIDKILFRGFPLIACFILLFMGVNNLRIYLKLLALILISIFIWFVIGIFIAVNTWQPSDDPFLPPYAKYQPFDNYWTVFICLGIATPFLMFFKNIKNKLINDEVLDLTNVD